MAFNYKRDRRDQKIDAGDSVDSGVDFTGKARDFKNQFVAKMKDTNIDPNKQSLGQFGNIEAQDFLNTTEVLTDGIPNFIDQNQQARAEDFKNKWANSVLIPEEDKINATGTLDYLKQDPNSNLDNNIGYAGSDGVKPS